MGETAGQVSPDRPGGLLVVPFVVASLLQLRATLPVLTARRPPLGVDAWVFEYAGLISLQGSLPYVHIWDVKPPLTYATASGLAALAGGDPLVTHQLNVLVMGGLLVGVVTLASLLTYELTDDRTAGVVSGLAVPTFSLFYTFPAYGLRPKMYVMFFGLLGVYLCYRRRPFWSGLSAAAAAGYWQLGIVFPLLVVGLTVQHSRQRDLGRVVAGMVTVTALAVAPYVLAGEVTALLNQVVFAQLFASESGTVLHRTLRARNMLGRASLFGALGCLGVVWAALRSRETWWVAAGTGLYLVQILELDLDGPPDLLPLYLFLAVGVGLLVSQASETDFGYDGVPAVIAGVVVVAAVGLILGDLWALRGVEIVQYSAPQDLSDLYWQAEIAESCHLRMSHTEEVYLETIGAERSSACGQTPSWKYL
ncbi:DolP-mannose mannosyltransferase [Halorussus lipolyticus]|uniref:DolP-mannose mannosyltransferase n=1 Tax=Halorussus lipolyticus TaxID=3034024 RepID=UPI0023E82311|nr:DolP-mannose mannosyltransferase [Halorussus sp. DT80]